MSAGAFPPTSSRSTKPRTSTHVPEFAGFSALPGFIAFAGGARGARGSFPGRAAVWRMIPRAAVFAGIGPGSPELLRCGALAAAGRPDRTVGPEGRTHRPGLTVRLLIRGRAMRLLRVQAAAPRRGRQGGRGGQGDSFGGIGRTASGFRGGGRQLLRHGWPAGGGRGTGPGGAGPGRLLRRTDRRPDGQPAESMSAVRLRRTRARPGNMGLIYRVDEGERLVSRERLVMRGAYSY